ncbi:carboxymuconolactone decarboxylase family protein [Aliivibrio sp. S4TY2]|uniref:carboxymuconolactone decarboxylase family protein n=1 Tax=unclassified Aliivibrio TaxID=2645654 RepID=UPI0023784E14|nr:MULTISPECIES: carboxymuconolactone decarboxylase family protein [unclassified Aliivibrio]MDD9155149.1 carboxymuconolactone decarboxylase family protein [Aliivibrio sp. S4TY2]MDD9159299.1 carboxymuconolactone decarboxylase family protein [Aliivibrio sp. S4TY1]MDD9163151.1 carboxymuconolactone decarboxylase family protein [Aliivibrio sp. S4MY2]MDD9167298.1 carboxymuconolactone decarboxylase family protein [Aliivibrio sp. S4MY4]MDD9184228.1 carboxymuconolactone decarboxylase family protein [Al
MTSRIDIAKIQPKALNAMLSIESYLSGVTLSVELKELIKIRASMINKCAYCIQMHVPEAEKAGVEAQKLFALAAWKESPLFSATERAVLALTDDMTLIAHDGVSDTVYQEALEVLGEEQLAQAMMQVIMINAWNRFALATQMTH